MVGGRRKKKEVGPIFIAKLFITKKLKSVEPLASSLILLNLPETPSSSASTKAVTFGHLILFDALHGLQMLSSNF